MWIVTKEALIGITRTAVAYVYAWLLTSIPAVNDFLFANDLVDEADGLIAIITVVIGTLLYSLIRWAAEKWPAVGYFLIFNVKPEYAGT